MDRFEAAGLVWEALAKAPTAWSSTHVIDATGLDGGTVRRVLAALRENKLVEADVSRGSALFAYTAVRELDALGWARAVEIGVPLSVLEAHAKLASGVRDEALRLALAGRLDTLSEQAHERKRQERDRAIEGRIASRVAATDLAQLVSDTRAAASLGRFRPVSGSSPAGSGEGSDSSEGGGASENAGVGGASKKGRGRGGKVAKSTSAAAVQMVPREALSPRERAIQDVLERAQEEANRALSTLLNHLRASST